MSDLSITVAGELITPEGESYPLAVRMTFANDVLAAVAPSRNEDLSTILWRLGFRWQNCSWQRATRSADLGVEVAHLLLREGFKLRVADETFRQLILAGDYVPEVTRWIRLIPEGAQQGSLTISWCRQRDETYYKRSTSLTGARWDSSRKCVVAPPDAAEEVRDFAKLHDFTISEAAQKAIDSQGSAALEKLRVPIKPRKVRKQPPAGQVDESLVDDSAEGGQ